MGDELGAARKEVFESGEERTLVQEELKGIQRSWCSGGGGWGKGGKPVMEGAAGIRGQCLQRPAQEEPCES